MSKSESAAKKSKIGGQAVIEGVMMKGIHQSAMACRLPNGEIDVEVWDEENLNVAWYRKTPFLRGICNFFISMKDGYKYLMKSANKQMVEDENVGDAEITDPSGDILSSQIADDAVSAGVKPSKKSPENSVNVSKLDAWLEAHLSEGMVNALMGVATVLGFALSLFLFVFVPTKLCQFVPYLVEHRQLRTVVEGLLKIAVFIGYLSLTSLMKDIKVLYKYHGAEHKTIACYEAGEELTVENVRKHSRLHPRCGTSFIFITLFISILVFCFIRFDTVWMRVFVKLPLFLPTVGISYELIRLAGRYSNPFTKIISAPGLQIQKITTREPDDAQIECAIAAMKPCIPENLEEDKW